MLLYFYLVTKAMNQNLDFYERLQITFNLIFQQGPQNVAMI